MASRSPVPLGVTTPLPLTRKVRPERVPAGMRSFTELPSRVGTAMSAPRVASGKVMGTAMVRSRALRWNRAWDDTRTMT